MIKFVATNFPSFILALTAEPYDLRLQILLVAYQFQVRVSITNRESVKTFLFLSSRVLLAT